MNDYDTEVTGAFTALQDSFDGVTMDTPVERLVATGRTRLRRRRLAGVAAGAVAVTGLGLGVATYANPSTAPPSGSGGTTAAGVHIHTVAYSVDTKPDGTVQVTWDKQQYFEDRAGLQEALRKAGFPVLIKVGEFCRGPQDDGKLDPSGVAPEVATVMKAEREADDKVTFIFTPSAMPAGKELFIGYLNSAQLAVTQGRPGSVERLVPTGVPLICTTVAPPRHPDR